MPQSRLSIQLLGGFHLTYGDRPVTTVNQARVQSLFAYLLLHRHAAQARHHLAFTFWPDTSEGQARNNLRQMLHHLRHALPQSDQLLRADANTVQWLPSDQVSLDVADFEEDLAHAVNVARGSDRQATCGALQTALDFYKGDLLPSCYDDWIAPERQRLRQRAIQAFRQLVLLHEEMREYGAALAVARRLLQLDPLEESTYLSLIRLHALTDDRAGALRVYHDCVTILRRELEVEPGDAVQAAYQQLLHRSAQPIPAAPPSPLIGSLPLIGRQPEWQQLLTVWQQAANTRPVMALITGEAGIGKTRLAEELFDWARRQGITVARTRAYAAEGRLSYGPVGEWLRQPALAPVLSHLDTVWLSEVSRVLPELLIRHPNLPPPTPLTEHWQRQHFFEALAQAILAVHGPLMLLLDDLQWCDQETLEWMHFLLRFDAKARFLVLGTARDEEMHDNPALLALVRTLQETAQLVLCPLDALDAAEVAKLATHVVEREVGVGETMHLFRETEGNPLFVVEIARATLEDKRDSIGAPVSQSPLSIDTSTALPPRVYAVIARRLSQLSAIAHEVACVAATIGRAFTLDVLARASGKDEESLVDALDEMWQRRIIREQGVNHYDFSHDKLRDVAYCEISPMQRRRLHRRVAEALEQTHAADLDPVSGQLAAHLEQAGFSEKSILYYQQAALVSKRVLAYGEATAHLKRGLDLLTSLPTTADHQRQELALLIILGTILSVTKGYATAEVGEIYKRARELCQLVGDKLQTFVVQQELRILNSYRGQWMTARQLAAENLTLAQEINDAELLQHAHKGMAVTFDVLGEFSLAQTHYEQVMHQKVVIKPGFDHLFPDDAFQATLRCYALHLWLLGYPDQARGRMTECLVLGQQDGQSIRCVMTLYFAARFHYFLGEPVLVQQRAEESIALCMEQGFPEYLAASTLFRAWAQALHGEWEEGIAQLRQNIAAQTTIGRRNFLPYDLALLSEAYQAAGKYSEALATLNEALAVVEETNERIWQAEILRLRGEIILAQGAAVWEVDFCFRQAIDLARQQEAKSLELRATMSMARLWHSAGRTNDALRLLTPIYEWFTEGFDTPDLQQARALLKELSNLSPIS